ncbi:hypothetical protein HMPREF3203_02834 [Proteus mirabilis]|nr:hypothetical protein HMPREF3203_02834 [Proteus mirabilis]
MIFAVIPSLFRTTSQKIVYALKTKVFIKREFEKNTILTILDNNLTA